MNTQESHSSVAIFSCDAKFPGVTEPPPTVASNDNVRTVVLSDPELERAASDAAYLRVWKTSRAHPFVHDFFDEAGLYCGFVGYREVGVFKPNLEAMRCFVLEAFQRHEFEHRAAKFEEQERQCYRDLLTDVMNEELNRLAVKLSDVDRNALVYRVLGHDYAMRHATIPAFVAATVHTFLSEQTDAGDL